MASFDKRLKSILVKTGTLEEESADPGESPDGEDSGEDVAPAEDIPADEADASGSDEVEAGDSTAPDGAEEAEPSSEDDDA